MRKCAECRKIKPLDDFYFESLHRHQWLVMGPHGKPDGLSTVCSGCQW
jgi:hypothetical protein